jgi:hypothetical protein
VWNTNDTLNPFPGPERIFALVRWLDFDPENRVYKEVRRTRIPTPKAHWSERK